jgi:ribosome-associated toxin RatA of RatAB toxin-antitoxin module
MVTLLTMLLLTQNNDSMMPLLARGQLVLVEPASDGKFGSATAIVTVDAAPEKVWATLLKMEDFKEFMPKVITSEVLRREKNEMDFHFVIEVPGPDTDYNIRYTKDDAKMTLTGTWMKGDLKGSRWLWKVEALPDGRTLLSQQLSLKNFSSLAASVEDEQQTITVGVNVSSAIAGTKALKRRCEQPPPPAPAAK